jgi:hypothetical protein
LKKNFYLKIIYFFVLFYLFLSLGMSLERNENEQTDTRGDRLESLIAQTPSLNYQLSSASEDAIMNVSEDNETESSSSFIKDNVEEIDKGVEIETDEESDDDDDKTVCDDEQDLIDQDPLYELLSQDYMNVHLDNRLKSAVRKFLRARFCKYYKEVFFAFFFLLIFNYINHL